MRPMIKDLVRFLSEVNCTPKIAIPILELMMVLLQFPGLMSDLEPRHYEHIVKILVPYADPFKFTNFIVSLAYRALFRWFLRIPVADRQPIAQQIVSQLEKMIGMKDVEQSLQNLHQEAKETCLNFLALYTFSDHPMIKVGPEYLDFAFKSSAGTKSWLLGGRIVTIRFGGSSEDYCQKCRQWLLGSRTAPTPNAALPAPPPQPNIQSSPDSAADWRRRHKSAIQPRRNLSGSCLVRPPPLALDDSCINANAGARVERNPPSSASSLLFESPLGFLDRPLSELEEEILDAEAEFPVCGCWLKDWAEVTVRQPWGLTCWKVQGEQNGFMLKDLLCAPTPDPSSAGFDFTASSNAAAAPNSQMAVNFQAAPEDPEALNSNSNGATRHMSFGGQSRKSLASVPPIDASNLTAEKRTGSVASSTYFSTVMSDPNLPGLMQTTAQAAPSPVGNDPSLLFMQLYHGPMQSVWLKGKSPLLLPKSDAVERAIKNIDRITAFETRKLGVLYLGPEQKTATEMLSNQFGSIRYEKFLDGLGKAIRLEDVDPSFIYIGGLETGGKDGKFTYQWSDPITQVVFHVATLMPTKESDPECRQKKLHIGNDYVTIVYNDSGEEVK